jgi:hypothetical protein
MELTEQAKKDIDNLSHYELLKRWRFAPMGDLFFQGEIGKYWGERMQQLRDRDPAQAVRDSKSIGWGR